MTDYCKDKQQLTDEQIAELVPDWATHYSHNVTTLTFSNTEKAVITDFKGVHQCSEHDNEVGFTDEDKPIPHKKLDISEYEFDYLPNVKVKGNEIQFIVCDIGCDQDFYITKLDAIALAKHFNLTAEDLK